jgi:hypothetical protein
MLQVRFKCMHRYTDTDVSEIGIGRLFIMAQKCPSKSNVFYLQLFVDLDKTQALSLSISRSRSVLTRVLRFRVRYRRCRNTRTCGYRVMHM